MEMGASKALIGWLYCPRNAEDISNCSVIYTNIQTNSVAGVTCIGICNLFMHFMHYQLTIICIFLDQNYYVKVTPLNISHNFYIGTTGVFNCSVTPDSIIGIQNVNIRYYWYTSLSNSSYSTTSSTTSIFFHQGYSKFNNIICEVRANNVVLNWGYYINEVKGNKNIVKCKTTTTAFHNFFLSLLFLIRCVLSLSQAF